MKERNLNFDEVIDRRHTDCIKFDSAAANGMPEDVLPLWVADMDFRTSSAVADALRERVEHGIFGYSDLGGHYCEAVSGWFERHHGMKIEPEWIVKTPGVVFALAAAVRAFTEKGDAVLIQQPVYYPFTMVIVENGRRMVSSDLVLSPEGQYQIDFEDFEAKIRENKVKLFILCSPHNPVGRVWTREELERVGQICLRNGVTVVSDEIHADFVYSGFRHTMFAGISEELREITVTCTAPSKTFNLAGLQTSNIFIANETLRKKYQKELSGAGYNGLNLLGAAACEAAYRYGEEWYQALMHYLEGNLDFLRAYIKEQMPRVKLIEPQGTYLVWLDCRELGLSKNELEDFIVHKAGLWLDGGAMFGTAGTGFQRINIATNRSTLQKALDRLKEALSFLPE